MASRHQRRKRARAKAIAMANRTTERKFSDYVSETVKRNLARPKPERSFAPSSVDLVQRSFLGSSVRQKRTLPYQKHHAGDTSKPADYKLDKQLFTYGERKLRSLRKDDERLAAPAASFPVIEKE